MACLVLNVDIASTKRFAKVLSFSQAISYLPLLLQKGPNRVWSMSGALRLSPSTRLLLVCQTAHFPAHSPLDFRLLKNSQKQRKRRLCLLRRGYVAD